MAPLASPLTPARSFLTVRLCLNETKRKSSFSRQRNRYFLKTDSDEFRSRRQRMQQRYCSMLVHLFPERGLILISAIPATKIDISTGSNSCAYSVVIFNIAKSTPCVVDRSFSRRLEKPDSTQHIAGTRVASFRAIIQQTFIDIVYRVAHLPFVTDFARKPAIRASILQFLSTVSHSDQLSYVLSLVAAFVRIYIDIVQP